MRGKIYFQISFYSPELNKFGGGTDSTYNKKYI